MRLAKLRVKGYRSIKKDESLVTDERITILIGANDHGKSNLLAAIRCLNDEDQITIDDRNWDLSPTDPVEIVWHFAVDGKTLETLQKFAPKILPSSPPELGPPVIHTEAEVSESAGTAIPSSASLVAAPSITPAAAPAAPTQAATAASAAPVTAPPATAISAPVAPAATAEPPPASPTVQAPIPTTTLVAQPETTPLISAASEEVFPVNQDNEIVFVRDLSTNEVRIISMPLPVVVSSESQVLALRPRVELFESPSGNVVDQVTRSELETPAFEFMQGIFRLAGLWEGRNEVFAQNDRTSKQLKEASAELTKILNDQWNQGKDLKWIFEHTGNNGDTIVIKIEDPAIKGRYTRPSLRSSGFRTYFLLSMIIYARSQNTPHNSHIYLFDEPGTYLHPSAQLDLQRSFETIADQAQLAYTTHSLFLISKNYPSRNRVVSKSANGTKIDQKPFSKNWKSVRQSLGILLSNNFLIAEKTLLVEGPSDAIYLLDALKKLKSAGLIDVDLNDMSIVDAGDTQNYVAMAKIMLSEGRNIVALLDGDTGGKKIQTQLETTCSAEMKSKKLQVHLLPDNKSSEDVFADLNSLQNALRKCFEKLVSDGTRVAQKEVKIEGAVREVKLLEGTTLGKTVEKVTKAWFVPPDKISKLFIAIFYEDEVEESKACPPTEALAELEKIKGLLALRSEKSKQAGVFEEVE
jgi:predicted ATP-dependent endonuclease of OLD family